MPYRDKRRCHYCGQTTTFTCNRCKNATCETHLLENNISPKQATRPSLVVLRKEFSVLCLQCAQEILEKKGGPFTPIYRHSDPIRIQMYTELLKEEGYDARQVGTGYGSLLGAGQHIFEQRIEVPQGQAEEAITLLEAIEHGKLEEEEKEE